MTLLQVVPSQVSTNVLMRLKPLSKLPTATQFVVVAQDTPLRVASTVALGFGEGVIVHVVPFQVSTSVCR